MYCKKCGAQIAENSKFCAKCGAATDVDNASEEPNAPEPAQAPPPPVNATLAPAQASAVAEPAAKPAAKLSNRGIIIIAGSIVAIIALVFILMNVFGNSSRIRASVGDVIQFGGIDWLVLDIQDGKALLLSEKILEERPYHSEIEYITWAGSSMRRYLNGEFYNRFTAEERGRILETRVINSDNHWYGTTGGADTTDRVFLLSIDEVVRYFGDSGQLWNRPNDEWWIDDEYNQARVAYRLEDNEAWWWWLRSPGSNSYSAANVLSDGWLNVSGNSVHRSYYGGVRPAMWLNLQS